jgi:hypothetical protein
MEQSTAMNRARGPTEKKIMSKKGESEGKNTFLGFHWNKNMSISKSKNRKLVAPTTMRRPQIEAQSAAEQRIHPISDLMGITV